MATRKKIVLGLPAASGSTGLVQALSETPVSPISEIDVSLLDLNPLNPDSRTEPGPELDELASSIGAVGLIQPLIVQTKPDGRYLVLAGHRRLAAARQAGLAAVPVVVRDDLAGQDDIVMIAENRNRTNLTPIEEASAFARLADKGWSQTRIADEVGITQAQVSRRLTLLNLPAALQTAIDSGGVPVVDALEVRDEDPEVVSQAVALLNEDPSRSLKQHIWQVREDRRVADEKAQAEVWAKAHGLRVRQWGEWCYTATKLGNVTDHSFDEAMLTKLAADKQLAVDSFGTVYKLRAPRPAEDSAAKKKARKEREAKAARLAAITDQRIGYTRKLAATITGSARLELICWFSLSEHYYQSVADQLRAELAPDVWAPGYKLMLGRVDVPAAAVQEAAWVAAIAAAEDELRAHLGESPVDKYWKARNAQMSITYLRLLVQVGYQLSLDEQTFLADLQTSPDDPDEDEV